MVGQAGSRPARESDHLRSRKSRTHGLVTGQRRKEHAYERACAHRGPRTPLRQAAMCVAAGAGQRRGTGRSLSGCADTTR